MEVSESFKDWWRKYDDVERCRLIKDKAIELNQSHKALVRALDATHKFGNNRTGVRGGRSTSLQAQLDKTTKRWLDLTIQLKYMVATL